MSLLRPSNIFWVSAQLVGKLLGLGVSLDALRAGLEELPVERPCPVENAVGAVLHGYRQGEPLTCHGRVLMALFLNCCMYTHPAALDEGTVSGTFGAILSCFLQVLAMLLRINNAKLCRSCETHLFIYWVPSISAMNLAPYD